MDCAGYVKAISPWALNEWNKRWIRNVACARNCVNLCLSQYALTNWRGIPSQLICIAASLLCITVWLSKRAC